MEEELYKFLEDWTDRYVAKYKDKLGDSRLADSITSIIEVRDDDYSITLDLNHYWYYVENGRKPGRMPPFDAMLRYAKTIIPKPYRLPSGKQVIPSEKSLAYMLMNHIGAKGTKPTFYLAQIDGEMESELVEGATRILKQELKNIIK